MKAVSVMYHDVVAGGRFDESGFAGADAALYKLGREEFARHLDALSAARADAPALVTDLAPEAPSGPNAGGRMPWLLTFDDGGVSAATVVADMLEARGWRGHFFVTTGRVGQTAFLSREQVRELRERGHVVGSHSETHPARMSHCAEDELLGEWRRSLGFLSEVLGEEVRVASVPGGYYSRAVASAAAREGVTRLFTSEPTERVNEVDGCLVFGRYGVQRWTGPAAVAGIVAGEILPRRRQQLAWTLKKLTKRVGGEYYLRARRALINRG
ncbi:MAG TPA: polysaccharide deacetylase family protein [Pyrinomonadaceae bacterium]|nr:polysaccharide deacetylase family protein [Pyrinomonadaceae bacterium]